MPVVLKWKKRIVDYQPLDLERLSAIHHALGAHLHHISRFDEARSATSARQLESLLGDAISYLSDLLRHPRYWIEFHDADQKLFEQVIGRKLGLDEFIRHIETGRLKSFTIRDVHHLQEMA